MKVQNLFVGMFLLLLWSCGRQQAEQLPPGLDLKLSADSSSVLITGIPRLVMEQLKSDSLTADDWHRLLAVYEEGNELLPVAGRYSTDSLSIIFTPDGGFKKGRSYGAECYIRNQPYNPRQMAAGRSGLFNPGVYRESFDF